MLFDPLYILVIIATLVVSGGAQLYIRSTYGRWSRVQNGAGLSGAQVAEYLRDNAQFGNRPGREAITAIKVSPGELSDHFDPRDRSLSLSEAVATQPSVASMAIAAHEVGHAVQVAEGSALMQLRGLLVPAVSFGPGLAYLFIIGGIILNMTGLLTIGILLFGLAVLFAVLTLPVEIQASQKALAMLEFDRRRDVPAGPRRRQCHAARRGADVPRRRDRRDPDPALLPDPGSPQQLIEA